MFKKLLYIIFLLLKQRKFRFHDHSVSYIYQSGKSKHLIIVYSGFSQPNQKAKFNYVKTLQHVSSCKLFILDDIGPNQRGAYYLGHHRKFDFASAVETLIYRIKKENNLGKTIFCGSSKGGYSAMYFALRNQGDVVISGA